MDHISLSTILKIIILPVLSSFIFVSFIHPFIIKVALLKGITDNPDARKLQKTPIPVMGGVAVFFGIVAGIGIVSIFFDSYALFTSVFLITIMMYLGFADDILGLSPYIRFLCEALVILFVMRMDSVSINNLHGLFGIDWLPVYLSVPLTLIGSLGIINAINLIDGVDGLSSGFCLMACTIFGLVFLLSKDAKMTILAMLSIGALIPFFFHNVFGKTSKMFIGDSGTLMMGGIMAMFCMHIISTNSPISKTLPNIGIIAFCLSVLSGPIFDTLRVMTARIIKGVSPFRADKSHLHHLFIEIGFSHIGTTFCVLSLNFINIVCWFISYMLGASATVQFIIVFVIGLVNTTGFYYVVRRLNKTHVIYRILKRGAELSRMERDGVFIKLRSIVDRF